MKFDDVLKLNKKPIMEKYFDITTNPEKPVLLETMNTSAIYKRHGKHGMVIISANRSNKPKEVNDANAKRLIADIQKEHFRYMPVYGGYRGKDGVEDDYEPSFLVFPFDTVKKEWVDFNKLQSFAVAMCGKYEQDSVFVMRPDQAPNYLNKSGEKVNSKSSKEIAFNDLTKEFFISFKDKESSEKEQEDALKKKFRRENAIGKFDDYKKKHLKDLKTTGRRFTSDIQFEWFANPLPCTLSERMRRMGKGEVIYEQNTDLI